jgi:hypothetical protein
MYTFFSQSRDRLQICEAVGGLAKCNRIITIPLLFCNNCALVYSEIKPEKKNLQETNITGKCEKINMSFSINLSMKQAVRYFYDATVLSRKEEREREREREREIISELHKKRAKVLQKKHSRKRNIHHTYTELRKFYGISYVIPRSVIFLFSTGILSYRLLIYC